MTYSCYWTTILWRPRPWEAHRSSNPSRTRWRNGRKNSSLCRTSWTNGWR